MNRDVREFEKQLEVLLTQEAPPEELHQLRWLRDHLEVYLERWLGFARKDNIPLQATLENKIFSALLAGINVMDAHLNKPDTLGSMKMPQWDEFKNAVKWICRSIDREELGIVERTFDAFSKALSQRVEGGA